MKACLTSDALSEKEAVQRAVTGQGVIGMDYVREVSTLAPYQWDPDDRLSGKWSVASGTADEVTRQHLPPVRHRIAAYDYGIKENILRRLRQNGFPATLVPAANGADALRALAPARVF